MNNTYDSIMGLLAALMVAAALQATLTLAHGDEAASVSVSDFKADFSTAQIVPEVLAAFNPSVAFYAGFASADGDAALLTPGMTLTTPGMYITCLRSRNTD